MDGPSRRRFLGSALGVATAGVAGCSTLQTHHRWSAGGSAAWPVVTDDTLYAVVENQLGIVEDGSVTWRADTPLHDVAGAPATLDGLVALPIRTGVVAFEDRGHAWTAASTGGLWKHVAAGAGRLFAVSRGAEDLRALDPESGETLWRGSLPGDTTGAPVVRDGAVYVPCSEGVRAFNVIGTERWTAAFGHAGSLRLGDEAGYVTGEAGLYGVDLRDGTAELLWEKRDTLYGAPTVGPEQVYVGSDAGTLYALDRDGNHQWGHAVSTEVDVSGGPYVGPPVLVDGEAVFTASDHADAGGTYAVDAASGDRRWHAGWGDATTADGPSSPVRWGNSVVVTDENGVHALSPGPQWKV